MAQKTVFNIFPSFGPAGSIVNIAEKLCKNFFAEAYELGEAKMDAKEDVHIKKLRQDFCNELFNIKGSFETKSQSLNPLVQFKAYVDLNKMIKRYTTKIIAMEKQKLTREMAFYKGEENMRKFE